MALVARREAVALAIGMVDVVSGGTEKEMASGVEKVESAGSAVPGMMEGEMVGRAEVKSKDLDAAGRL